MTSFVTEKCSDVVVVVSEYFLNKVKTCNRELLKPTYWIKYIMLVLSRSSNFRIDEVLYNFFYSFYSSCIVSTRFNEKCFFFTIF